MKRIENIDVEWKEVFTGDIKKEVIAFANAEGGSIYIGIRNDGSVRGVDDSDAVMLQVSSALSDGIMPDVMPFVQIRTVEIEGKAVVEIEVQVGTRRPYYLKSKGLRPSGVYIRQGSACLPVSDEGIRQLILDGSGKSYEDSRSMEQNLTFSVLEAEMQQKEIEFGISQMRNLHLIGEDGLYTNLAQLLSDQCEHSIKVAIFQGKEKEVFLSRKEFSGSLLKQLRSVYELIDLSNKTKATFSGLNRIDRRDYPEGAVREALINCIVHRDYAFSASTLVNIYENRVEFISLGGLVQGLSLEAILIGVSQSRNPNLASIFYRMGLIESYGTGISKIMRMYREEPKQPKIETAQGAFRVTLPNRNSDEDTVYEKNQIGDEAQELASGGIKMPEIRYVYASSEGAPIPYITEEERILRHVRAKGFITRKETESLLQIKTTKAYQLLRRLCEKGLLREHGSGRNRIYIGVYGAEQ